MDYPVDRRRQVAPIAPQRLGLADHALRHPVEYPVQEVADVDVLAAVGDVAGLGRLLGLAEGQLAPELVLSTCRSERIRAQIGVYDLVITVGL